MLIQQTHIDTVDKLNNVSQPNTNDGLLILTGLAIFGLSLLVIYRLKRKKENVIKEITNTTPIFNKEKELVNNINTVSNESDNKYSPKNKVLFKEHIHKPISNKYKELNVVKISENLKPEKETHSKIKHIGYSPINIFNQSEPLSYPYVLMPKPNCVIKFPIKGRNCRKGFKEDEFKQYILKYFKSNFQIFDDRCILVKNSSKHFEPDFTLIDETNDINIFIDIEIDEPYEGLNDFEKRKPTHYQHADINRNNSFKNRGWIVIRFAEIQVHKEPDSCCRFLADVLKSINPNYIIPKNLKEVVKLKSINQWTIEVAEKWSLERYRENYLGIDRFGKTKSSNDFSIIEETEIGDKIEGKVEDDIFIPIDNSTKKSNLKVEKISSAINLNKFLSFRYNNETTVVKPIRAIDNELIAFCYVKNRDRVFLTYDTIDLEIKDSYYTLRVTGPVIGIDQITNAVNTAISYNKLIRMKYTRASWSSMSVDKNTGEILIDSIKAEESIRTINNVQLAINVLAQEHIEAYNLNNNYITAYCNKREEQRTFRFDRIVEIEILNL